MYKHERVLLSELRRLKEDLEQVGDDLLEIYLNNKPSTWRLICVNSVLTTNNDECFDFFWKIPE